MKDALKYVYTSKEAAEIWGLSYQTVTQWYNRGKFENNEAKKSGGAILVTHQGMERIAGEINEEKRQKNILRREIVSILKKVSLSLDKLEGFEQYNAAHLIYECHRIKDIIRKEGFGFLSFSETKTVHEDTLLLLDRTNKLITQRLI
ncbi:MULTISPECIES: helix-turn-helix domain-containing protein [Bacillales]|uniref:helix-turn-helix domain-containing protein n=1 Tax=Bacillales TaxID=1385 RepID=UPI001F48DEAF|nr:helix-turn-helix domain-containing protein [Staphylococcus aureus]WAI29969.1 MAG: helix-turn-helix domain-containing protein [Bacillus paranthracis]WAI35716.1 MAG: helix-turn-helix domain-containing protein [Bacillus paranthracis]WAI41613.1 MAG: helix-turn-helix domain-containing protein [Bacillus paranthracis]